MGSDLTMPYVSADEENEKRLLTQENLKPAVSRRDLSYKLETRKMSASDVITP